MLGHTSGGAESIDLVLAASLRQTWIKISQNAESKIYEIFDIRRLVASSFEVCMLVFALVQLS